MDIKITPPKICALSFKIVPNFFPILIAGKQTRKVTIPITETLTNTSAWITDKPIPTAKASILVAMP